MSIDISQSATKGAPSANPGKLTAFAALFENANSADKTVVSPREEIKVTKSVSAAASMFTAGNQANSNNQKKPIDVGRVGGGGGNVANKFLAGTAGGNAGAGGMSAGQQRAAEETQKLEKNLNTLLEGFRNINKKNERGQYATTFGTLFKNDFVASQIGGGLVSVLKQVWRKERERERNFRTCKCLQFFVFFAFTRITLFQAKKRGMIDFEGEMLFQGESDNVPITLLKDAVPPPGQASCESMGGGGLLIVDVVREY